MARLVAAALVLFSAFATACGSGGGGTDTAVVPPPAAPPPPPPPPPGPVITPGVAYLADALVDEKFELFVADLDGDGAIKVSGTLANGGNVTGFKWSPDGQLLAFLGDKNSDEVFELYVVPAGGGNVVKVSAPLVAGGDVREFEWSPDSSRLAYLADGEVDEQRALFVTPAGGGAVRASGTMVAEGDVLAFRWAPDSSRVAYLANQDADDVYELFTSLADGSGNVQVSGAMVAGGSVFVDEFFDGSIRFAWAPDSSCLAYLADQDVDMVYELYRAAPDGSGTLKLSVPLAANHFVLRFAWAPDASRIAYVESGLVGGYSGSAHTVLPGGGGHVTISQDPLTKALLWSPSSARIVLAAAFGFSFDLGNLSFVDPDGTSYFPAGYAVPLNSYNLLEDSVAWQPTSQRLACPNVLGSSGVLDTIPNSFFHVVRLTDSLISYRWAPDGSRMGFTSDTGATTDLYVAHPDTPYGVDLVSQPLPPGRAVREFAWTPDSTRLVYSADVDTSLEFELFAVGVDGTGTVRVSELLVFGGQVVRFALR